MSQELKTILAPLVDTLVTEIQRITQTFAEKEIQRVVLGGGSALLPGLSEYLKENLKQEIEFVDPPVLEDTLKEMGPAYSVAVGMALRGLE